MRRSLGEVLVFVIFLISPLGTFGLSPEAEEVFDPDNDDEDSYMRRYSITVANKAEDCFFIPEVKSHHVLNFHFVVVNAGRSGQQLDVSWKVRSPSGKMIHYGHRKVEDEVLGHLVSEEGDYEICFNNRYSMMESKRVFWQFEVEGAFDEEAAKKQLIEETVEILQEATEFAQKIMRKVRSTVARARHQQWWLTTMGQKHLARLEAMQGMIDRWSLGHIFVLVAVGCVQLFVLRRLFETKPNSHKLSARA